MGRFVKTETLAHAKLEGRPRVPTLEVVAGALEDARHVPETGQKGRVAWLGLAQDVVNDAAVAAQGIAESIGMTKHANTSRHRRGVSGGGEQVIEAGEELIAGGVVKS